MNTSGWKLNDGARLPDGTRVQVTLNNATLAKLDQPGQMVARDLIRRGTKVAEAARRQVPLGHIGVRGPAAKHGRLNLRDQIHVRLVTRPDGNGALIVGSEADIALIHHEGTRPHVILPVRAKRLVFWSNKAGRVVVAKKVNHPGTKPNRYLTDNLHLAVQ